MPQVPKLPGAPPPNCGHRPQTVNIEGSIRLKGHGFQALRGGPEPKQHQTYAFGFGMLVLQPERNTAAHGQGQRDLTDVLPFSFREVQHRRSQNQNGSESEVQDMLGVQVARKWDLIY